MAWPAKGVDVSPGKSYNKNLDALHGLEENKEKWQEESEKNDRELRLLTKTYDLAVQFPRKKTRRNVIAESKGNHQLVGLKVTLRSLSGKVMREVYPFSDNEFMSDPEDLETIDFFRLAAIALCTVGEELTLVIGETHFNPLSEADLYTQFVCQR